MPGAERREPGGPKPIETTYNGYRFRSRLEARWAVFFDTLGVEYEYEKEGYQLDDYRTPLDDWAEAEHGRKWLPGPNMYYLPDFWLPDQQCFVEIKSTEPDLNTPEGLEVHNKSERLAWHTRRPVYLFYGECWIPYSGAKGLGLEARHEGLSASANVFFRQRYFSHGSGGHFDDPLEHVGFDSAHYWCECPWCQGIGIAFEGQYSRLPCGCQRTNNSGIYTEDDSSALSPRIVAAYLAARQARFEHGEKGR